MNLKIDPAVKDLMPSFIANRRRDLDAMRTALQAGNLAAIREVGHNVRAFSRVYGFDDLTALGEEIQQAADERSTLRIVHAQSRLADYLARVEFENDQ